MNKLNFYIQDDKVFDAKGNEIVPDENGIVKVDIDGKIRRFIRPKLIKWLEDNPDIRQAKVPKQKPIPSQWEILHPTKEKSNKKQGRPRRVLTDEERILAKERHRERTRDQLREKRGSTPRKPKAEKEIKLKIKLTSEQIKERDRQHKREWMQRYRASKPRKPRGRPRVHAYDELNRRIDLIPQHKGKYFGGKKIECTTTGKVYKSMYQVEKDLGINREAVRRVATGLNISAKGYQFKFIEQ